MAESYCDDYHLELTGKERHPVVEDVVEATLEDDTTPTGGRHEAADTKVVTPPPAPTTMSTTAGVETK